MLQFLHAMKDMECCYFQEMSRGTFRVQKKTFKVDLCCSFLGNFEFNLNEDFENRYYTSL